MPGRTLAFTLLLSPVLLAAGLAARAQADPATLPAHDAHQGLLVAADPYVSAERSKTKFGKHTPNEAGILAVDVYFKNDGDAPIRVNLGEVRLRIGAPGDARQSLDAISADDVADRTLLIKAPHEPTARRLPTGPLPGSVPKSGRNKDWQDFDALLRSAAMASEVLPPHATVHGFFYFDIDRHFDWLSAASLEVPDLQFMTTHQELFFFELDFTSPAR